MAVSPKGGIWGIGLLLAGGILDGRELLINADGGEGQLRRNRAEWQQSKKGDGGRSMMVRKELGSTRTAMTSYFVLDGKVREGHVLRLERERSSGMRALRVWQQPRDSDNAVGPSSESQSR
jgi:hypothetical protein